MSFNLELPINSLSFGQVSVGVLRELYKRKINPNIFPIGQVDMKSYLIDKDFAGWLQQNIAEADSRYSFNIPSIKLWHIMGSHSKLSKYNVLWTAHETDMATETESNLCNSFSKVLFTSKYSQDVFKEKIGEKAGYCPNYFDDLHFFRTNQKYVNSDKVVIFGLFGKMENRKNTINTMITWANQYGNNKDYRLNCAIFNPFLLPDVQSNQITSAFKGQVPWNISFQPFQEKNIDYNNILNSVDIDITGLSGAEGFNLPLLTSLCLGKQAVVLNEHAHKDYCDEDNSILVNSSGKKPIYDGQFFKEGAKYNQGNMYNFSIEDASEAMRKAVTVAKSRNVNGELLKDKFSVSKTVDTLLNNI